MIRFTQLFFVGSLFAMNGAFAAGPAAAGGGSAAGGGGGHAAAPAAAPAAHSSPAAPVAAAPTANPTTPAGAHETSQVATRQPAAKGAAAATDNGSSHAHHRNLNQGVYGNSFLPDATGWYGNSDGNYGNTNNNNNGNSNYSTDNSQPAEQPTPTPAPVTPSDNATSVAAQTDNAINHSPAIVSSSDEVSRAQAAFDADRQRVLSQLAQKPEYQQALSRQKNASKDMSDVKPLGAGVPANQTPAPAVMNAAAAKLDASDEVTKMQEDAIAADPQAAADKDRLTKLEAERDTAEARMRSQH